MEKYTVIQPVVMEDWPDAHNVFLQVTNQRFCVTPHGCETKDEAEWFRGQLCIALAKIAEEAVNECKLDNDRMRRVLEIIAGQASDKLQAAQARCALDNIGP